MAFFVPALWAIGVGAVGYFGLRVADDLAEDVATIGDVAVSAAVGLAVRQVTSSSAAGLAAGVSTLAIIRSRGDQ